MKLCIYGAGGAARSVYEIAKAIQEQKAQWEEIVFLDDFTSEKKKNNVLIYSFEEICSKYKMEELEFVVGNGEPQYRKMLSEKIEQKGGRLVKLLHPTAQIGTNVILEAGVIIGFNVMVGANAIIKKNTWLQQFSMIGHDCIVGENNVISTHCFLGGNLIIGDKNFLAAGALVSDRLQIGNECIIGLGAAVTKNVADEIVVIGNPAKYLPCNGKKFVFDGN